ncbi:MAG: metallophosphatase domain-containing protein [Polyangiaceae bacterium]
MRIVAVADTHLYTGRYVVPEGDVFIHAGDLCRQGSLDEVAYAAAWIRSLPHPVKVVIAGNHDWAFARQPEAARAALGEGIVFLEDSGTEVGGVHIWGSPWQPAFGDWAFNLPRGPEIAARWAAIPDGTEVLVTHGPPAGFGDRVHGRHEGCADLLARVCALRPRLHLYGHIHEDGGVWDAHGTCFANVTSWECSRPATVIDIDASGVRPVDVPPREG